VYNSLRPDFVSILNKMVCHSNRHQLYYSKTERYEAHQLTRGTVLYTPWYAIQAQPTAGFSTGKQAAKYNGAKVTNDPISTPAITQ